MSDERNIVLALSGGGFRATLFHLGVVRFLYEADLLTQIQGISAVSGGSVFAAHLILNWDRYTGDATAFDAAAQEVIAFVGSDVRGRVIRRWLLAWVALIPRIIKGHYWTFTNLLQSEYKRLYGNTSLKNLDQAASKNIRPTIALNCTSLNTGSPCFFSSSGFTWYDGDIEKSIIAPETEVSFAVAASSAFPPLFPPIVISHRILSCDRKHFPNPLYLTDGGVYDNLGVDRLLRQSEQAKEIGTLLISDAEGNFDWNFDTTYKSITTRNIRASDLMMKRVSDLEYVSLSDLGRHAIFFKIGSEIQRLGDERALSPEIQRSLRNIRTDLDAFSSNEIRCLIQHGYTVAKESATKNSLISTGSWEFHWNLVTTSERPSGSDLQHIRRAAGRKLRLWANNDWVSWISALIVLAASLIFVQILRMTTWVYSQDISYQAATIPDIVRADIDAEGPFSRLAISADGSRIVFVSNRHLVIRFLSQEKTRVLAETEGARYPFFSPDGHWVAFFAKGSLQKINVEAGGDAQALCKAPDGRGGSWADDHIIVAALNSTGGLSRVPETGGNPEPLTDLKDEGDVDSHRWPQTLPGGAVLFTATAPGGHRSLQILPSGAKKPLHLVEDGEYGRYAKNGHIIYYQGGSLYAARFDLISMRLDPPTPLGVGVAFDQVIGADFDISNSGTLIYRGQGRQVVSWIDSDGKRFPLLDEAGSYSTPRLSPDNARLALAVERDGQRSLQVFDCSTEVGRRVTFDLGSQSFPLWTQDGQYLVFQLRSTLAWIRASGDKQVDILRSANHNTYPWSFSPDGKLLTFTQSSESGWDMWIAHVERTAGEMRITQPQLFDLKISGLKTAPAISPDGKWLAYALSGQSEPNRINEIYVSPLSDPARSRQKISVEGGRWPIWAKDRNELFYENYDHQVVVASYSIRGGQFVLGSRRLWSKDHLAIVGDLPAFDVTHDGKRVAALFDVGVSERNIHAILNIDVELHRRDRTSRVSK